MKNSSGKKKQVMQKKAAGGGEKSSRKKQKKEVQREMVLESKNNLSINSSDSGGSDTGNCDDLDLSVDSAFIQSIVQNKCKTKSIKVNATKNSHSDNSIEKMTSNVVTKNTDLHDEGFITVTKLQDKSNNKEINYGKTPDGWGISAHKLILQRDKAGAIKRLTNAILHEPMDIRHYINRSYSYLGTGNNIEALHDIEYIISHTDDPILLSKIKCRQGQVLSALKYYNKAAECFKESLDLTPNCLAISCEALRMKVIQLTEMGFVEKDVLNILQMNPMMPVQDVATTLIALGFGENQNNKYNFDLDDNDDELYVSEDEDHPSNTSLFMKAIQFNDKEEDNVWTSKVYVVEKKNIVNPNSQKTEIKTELKVINTVGVQKTVKKSNINDKAVWVGSLNSQLTESVLAKAFSKFGKVSNVHKPSGEGKFAFVNFVQSGPASKAVIAETIEVLGELLPIKEAKINK